MLALGSPAPTVAQRLRVPAYILLGVLSVLPLLDFAVSAWPISAGLVTWRFGSFAQLSATAAAPLVALLLLYAVAYACGDRRMLYGCAILATVYAILLIVASGSFPL